MKATIGIDLDNTIVSYDDLLYYIALEQEYIEHETFRSKKDIRDIVRLLPEGEILWQKLQAQIYGPRMKDAKIFEGVIHFFKKCKSQDIKICMVSHKTEYATYDTTGTNLRETAMDWLDHQGVLNIDSFGIGYDQIFFESSRKAKLERIKKLGCDYFIDDLEETFIDDAFPRCTVPILFDPNRIYVPRENWKHFFSWFDISEFLFSDKKVWSRFDHVAENNPS